MDACQRRLAKELQQLVNEPPQGLKIAEDEACADLRVWIVTVNGAEKTLYEGEEFKLRFKFDSQYPFTSPEVTFIGQNIPVHPHVYSNGHICLSILSDDWTPALNVQSVCLSIVSMLSSCRKKERPIDDAIYTNTCHKSPSQTRWWFHDDKKIRFLSVKVVDNHLVVLEIESTVELRSNFSAFFSQSIDPNGRFREMKRKTIKVHPKGIKKSAARHGEEEWLRMFQIMDYDEDGYVDLREFESAIRNSAGAWGVSMDVAEKLLEHVDRNNDKRMAKAHNMKMRRYVLYSAEWFMMKGKENKHTRYLLQYSCLPPPLFMLIITLMQIVAYFCYACDEPLSPVGPIPFNSLFILNPNRRSNQFWRYFTYMFIHIGYSHLIGNCFMQLLLGLPLEMVHKFWRIGSLYVCGVISGSLLMSAADPNTYLGGASGGVYTLISAHVSNVAINWGEIEYNWAHALVIGTFVVFDFGIAFYGRYFNGPDKISHTAHIGGFVAGLFLGIVLLRNLRLKKWEQIAWWICLIVYLLFNTSCLVVIYYKNKS